MSCAQGGQPERSRNGGGCTHVGVDETVRVDLVLFGVEVGVAAEVAADDEVGEHLVDAGVGLVLHDAEDVEAGQDGLCKLDVLAEGDSRVVAAADRVGCCDDSTPRLQGRDDASLRNGD